MTTTSPTTTLQTVLARLSSDYRHTVAYYGNIEARPGYAETPRRVLSGIGFPATSQFTYLTPSRLHVIVNEDTRPVTRVTFCPYGLTEDRRRIKSRDAADRSVRTGSDSGATGMRICPSNADYLVSSELDDTTYAEAKTLRLVRQITSSAGPAYHIIINRRGDVLVSAALDDTTRAAGDNAEISIDVAVESAFSILHTEHTASQFSNIIELPYTTIQIAALAALIGKLKAAYPAIPQVLVPSETSSAGFAYRWPAAFTDVTPRNLSNGAWHNHSPYDHADSDAPRIFTIAADRGAFDLTTEVFRTADSPEPRTGRSEAQTAVSQADTAGAESVMLGAYSVIAGEERATEMQDTPRREFFVQRIEMTHHDVGALDASAGHVAEASAPVLPSPAQNVAPHVFDFATGYWGDGKAY